jgi:amphiphysin
MNSFADESKFDVSNVPGAQIAEEYESKRSDAWSIIENLGIIKRIVSVCKSLHCIFDFLLLNQFSF